MDLQRAQQHFCHKAVKYGGLPEEGRFQNGMLVYCSDTGNTWAEERIVWQRMVRN